MVLVITLLDYADAVFRGLPERVERRINKIGCTMFKFVCVERLAACVTRGGEAEEDRRRINEIGCAMFKFRFRRGGRGQRGGALAGRDGGEFGGGVLHGMSFQGREDGIAGEWLVRPGK
jgi:hypothetical protein